MLNNRNTLAEEIAILSDLFLFAKHCENVDRTLSPSSCFSAQTTALKELYIEDFKTTFPALSKHILSYRIKQKCAHFLCRPLIRTRLIYTKLKQSNFQIQSIEKILELKEEFQESQLELLLYIYLIYNLDDSSQGFLPSVRGYCNLFKISPDDLVNSFVEMLPEHPFLTPEEQLLTARFSKRFPGAFLFSEDEPNYLSLEQMAHYLADPRTDEQVIGIIRADMEALFYANEDLDRTEKNQTHDKFFELLHSIDSPPFYMLHGMVWTNLDEDIFKN